jgi:acylphosphatase
MTEMNCVITGVVQGVRYRDYVQNAAGELGLVGYVRNNTDGTVQVVAQGEPEVLRAFVEYLHEGSVLSSVESVSVDWGTARNLLEDFSVKY